MRQVDCVVVGGGPAGLSAAIQLVRMDREVLLFERESPGGLLREAFLVENYPGFPGGIKGSELADLMVDQARDVGVEIYMGEVTCLKDSGEHLEVDCANHCIASKTIVLATGTSPRNVDMPGLQGIPVTYVARGVSGLPRDMDGIHVAVIGGGDAAFDYSLTIHERGGTPTIISRSEPRALGLLASRVEDRSITVLKNAGIRGITLQNHSGSCEDGNIFVTVDNRTLAFDLLLLACGREPEKGLFSDPLDNRIFPIGDVTSGWKRQTTMAVGSGVSAAMEIDLLLSKMEEAT